MPNGLDTQARDFADETSELLNKTITTGIRISPITVPNGRSLMGMGLTRKVLTPTPIPLARHAASARVWLYLFHSYALDKEGVWLMMTKSTYAVYSTADMLDDSLVLSVDFSRDPVNEYPAAHLHVAGDRQDNLTAVCGGAGRRETVLRNLHLPVGGKRYRPCLEDVLEFVILEGMAEGHDGWQNEIEAHRTNWYDRQLRAAVRRDQDAAASALESAGWSVVPPA